MPDLFCGHCDQWCDAVVRGLCTKCLRLRESMKPGDRVIYRHGKGWAEGAFVGPYMGGWTLIVRTDRGRELPRSDVWPKGTSRG